LIDNRVNKIDNKIPWLGDVPILGNLFKSSSFVQAKTELLVMVTPRLVKPLEAGQSHPLPKFPMPFMDEGMFDGKHGESPDTNTSRPAN